MPGLTHVRPYCRHFPNNNFPLDGSHSCDAPFALIGEAPGRRENETGRPFVGPSGYDWENWIKAAGLTRSMFYIDNCYPYQPDGNNLFTVPQGALDASIAEILGRIRRNQHRVIVPTGNTALHALFGDRKMKISDWRGSILLWEGKKCIPTIHPAATQRQKVLTKLCVADWARVAEEGKSGAYEVPQRHHVIDPSESELLTFDEGLWRHFSKPYGAQSGAPPAVLSVDVENDRVSHELTCVGFSFDPMLSITISTLKRDYDGDLERYQEAQRYIRNWLHPYPIVGQNFQTDLYKLVMRWPELKWPLTHNYAWDLMEMAHLDDPNDGGDTSEGSENETSEGLRIGMNDLATLTSLYTRTPFYKYLSSDFRWEKRAVYNGLDACCQREVFDKLWVRLNQKGLV